jgi:2-dehydropantoate 2-reductase
MKIAVIGPGAVGSYYGAKLCRDGHEVHFLLRSDYEQVRRHGVRILSPEGDFNVRPKCARTANEIGHSDLVLVSIKSTANEGLKQILPPLVSEQTAVLTLQNGLGNEEFISRIVSAEQILGGLCFVCLNRIAPGVIQHLAHAKIEMGEFAGWPEPRTHDIASAFRHAGIPCSVRDNLEKAHWEKLVWNIPFNGLGVASCAGYEAVRTGVFPGQKGECLTTDKLLADRDWLRLVEALMHEVIAAANAFGLGIPEQLAQDHIDKTRVMGAYKPSTLVDFERNQPIELDAIFFEPLRRAESKGVAVPQLRALCSVLAALNSNSPA